MIHVLLLPPRPRTPQHLPQGPLGPAGGDDQIRCLRCRRFYAFARELQFEGQRFCCPGCGATGELIVLDGRLTPVASAAPA